MDPTPTSTPTGTPITPETSYSTGPIRPPKKKKSKGWLVALLIVAGILTTGVLFWFGLLPGLPSGREFFQNHSASPNSDNPGFESSVPTEGEPVPMPTGEGSVSVELETIPVGDEATQSGENSNIPAGKPLTLQEIYAQCINSVVSIVCDSGSGTGVVLSADGYIITNCHVVNGARTVEVMFTDGRNLPARTVGKDAISDLAILYVDAQDLTPAKFGNSDLVQVGDTVVAIGDPLGVEFRGTMTDGIISAINRDVTTDEGRTMTVLQTNAALNPGNSGGPLINAYGQVIGINTMKIGDSVSPAGVEGLGFAIPSTTVKSIVDQLMTNGRVTGRPYLGISTREYYALEAFFYPAGLYITSVASGTDAADKGISAGNILLEFNGTPVTTNQLLQNALESCKAGETVTLVLYGRDGNVSIDVVLGEAQ